MLTNTQNTSVSVDLNLETLVKQQQQVIIWLIGKQNSSKMKTNKMKYLFCELCSLQFDKKYV